MGRRKSFFRKLPIVAALFFSAWIYFRIKERQLADPDDYYQESALVEDAIKGDRQWIIPVLYDPIGINAHKKYGNNTEIILKESFNGALFLGTNAFLGNSLYAFVLLTNIAVMLAHYYAIGGWWLDDSQSRGISVGTSLCCGSFVEGFHLGFVLILAGIVFGRYEKSMRIAFFLVFLATLVFFVLTDGDIYIEKEHLTKEENDEQKNRFIWGWHALNTALGGLFAYLISSVVEI